MLAQFKLLPRDNYLMIVGVFFMKAGQFMVMPFLAIYLQHFPHATPTKIGIAIGLGPLVYGFFSPLGGWLVDRFGCRRMTVLAQIASAFNIYFFFALENWYFCFFMSAILGLTRCIFDISSRTYRLHGQSLCLRRFSFSLRFTAINSAAGIGPIVGAIFASHHSLLIFKIIGVWYLILSGLSAYFLQTDTSSKANTSSSTVDSKTLWHTLTRDRTLSFLILAVLLFWVAFSQIDSTLPQYLQTLLPNSLKLYAILLMTNALMCASLQMILSHYVRNLPIHWLNRLGVALFFLSFVTLSMASVGSAFIFAIVLMTLAELLLAPIQDFLVSVIAPPQHLGAYYGAMGISVLGIGIGPMVGGMIYQHSSGSILFLSCATLILLIAYCYHQVFKRVGQQQTL